MPLVLLSMSETTSSVMAVVTRARICYTKSLPRCTRRVKVGAVARVVAQASTTTVVMLPSAAVLLVQVLWALMSFLRTAPNRALSQALLVRLLGLEEPFSLGTMSPL